MAGLGWFDFIRRIWNTTHDFVKTGLFDSSGNQIDSFGTDPVGLKDTGGTPINPAKEDGNLASIKAKTDNLDLAITALRDALRGASSKTLTDIATLLAAGLPSALVGGRLDVNVGAQPARAATTDSMTAKLATDAIQNGLTALTPKFAKVGAGSSGDNTLIAAVTSKKLRVLAGAIIWKTATDIYFKDGAGTAIFADATNVAGIAAGSGFVLPFNPLGWFETASGQALILNQSAANKGGGSLTYVEV